ncbi:hypothetical protein NUW54_g6749 [Trametes sanguinea]|uniref:Uncharacterized protein n=1 Tax=Trametes sanguinea TaxID=158606 RepID=A0ACC1PTX8_9APHY|nr:hypothetical protein NUW54_g6749 [Trametes sanguinea]
MPRLAHSCSGRLRAAPRDLLAAGPAGSLGGGGGGLGLAGLSGLGGDGQGCVAERVQDALRVFGVADKPAGVAAADSRLGDVDHVLKSNNLHEHPPTRLPRQDNAEIQDAPG